jgi:hypothetical protein
LHHLQETTLRADALSGVDTVSLSWKRPTRSTRFPPGTRT